ncbi:MAG: hypothetical protein N4S00_03855, partial [Lactobacillus crispatus]|nr:hypothetical protein [Lactobacillus crispatus]
MINLITGRKGSHSNTAINDVIFDKDKRAMITSVDKRREALMKDNSILKSVMNFAQRQVSRNNESTEKIHNSKVTKQSNSYKHTSVSTRKVMARRAKLKSKTRTISENEDKQKFNVPEL